MYSTVTSGLRWVNKKTLSNLKKSSDPFLCPSCLLANQFSEITSLKQTVSDLKKDLSSLEAKLTALSEEVANSAPPSVPLHPAADSPTPGLPPPFWSIP